MSDEADFTLPTAHFPEWWNIHTHRSNHRCWMPLRQDNYGLGRALFADWGRVGAVKVCRKGDTVEVVGQHTDGLLGKLQYVGMPSAVLSADYLHQFINQDQLSYSNPTQQHSEQIEEQKLPIDSSVPAYNFGYHSQLIDPIMGEQAAAAYLCGKVLGLVRSNTGSVSQIDRCSKSAEAIDCLEEVERLSSEGICCRNLLDQVEILKQITSELEPCSSTTILEEEEFANNLDTAPSSKRSKPNRQRSRKLGKTSHVLSHTIRCLLDGSHENNDRRVLAALDPSLVELASRTVNSTYMGHGLLHMVDQTLFWSLPTFSKQPSLFFKSGESDTKHISLSPHIGSALICELDVCPSIAGSNKFGAVVRWQPTSSSAGKAAYIVTGGFEQDQNTSIEHCLQPASPDSVSTVCMSPWVPGEWILGGHSLDQSVGDIGFVKLFSAHSETPLWSGHVGLNSDSEGPINLYPNYLEASNQSKSSVDQSFQDRMNAYNQSIVQAIDLDFYNSNPFGLRVGVGSHPAELTLSTYRRSLLLDTRQNSTCVELFSLLSSTVQNSCQFNAAEMFTSFTSKFVNDLYAIGATQYSMMLIDKRMPGRTVLHWSHNLPGAPVYTNLQTLDSQLCSKYQLPHSILTNSGQFPPDLSVTGLNFTGSSGPQMVGPSLLGSRTSCISANPRNSLPTRLLDRGSVAHRLRASICGMCVGPTSVGSGDYRVWVATSHGDLFEHCWLFDQSDLENSIQRVEMNNSDWLATAATVDRPDASNTNDHVPIACKLDFSQLTRMGKTELFEVESESCDDLWDYDSLCSSEVFSGRVVKTSQHLLDSLETLWFVNKDQGTEDSNVQSLQFLTHARLVEEHRRTQELHSLTKSAKKRLRRLKTISDQLLRTFD